MSLQPYSDEQLNFFKFISIVLDEFPKCLRHVFVDMWNKRIAPALPNCQLWDDSTVVHNLLLKKESPKSKIPMNSSFYGWDCTALFQATLHSRTFALPDSRNNIKTLGELYLKNRKPVPNPFHSTVYSSSKDPNETVTLAIDQLRLLRNNFCHLSNLRVKKGTFDVYVQCAIEAFKAVNFSTTSLEAIGNLPESKFPTKNVEGLIERYQKERSDFYKLLEGKVLDELDGIKELMTGKAAPSLIEIEIKLDKLLEARDTAAQLELYKESTSQKYVQTEPGPSGVPESSQLRPCRKRLFTETTPGVCAQSEPEKKRPSIKPDPSRGQETYPSTVQSEELESDSTGVDDHGPIDVLLMTSNDEEFTAASQILRCPKREDTGQHQGQLCLGAIGRNKVALLKSSPAPIDISGSIHALLAETVQKLQPKAIVGLGVCSGTKKEVQSKGDVLVSSQVNFYNPDDSTNPLGPTFDCTLGLAQLFDCGKLGWCGPRPAVLVPKVHVGQVVSGSPAVDKTTHMDEMRNLYPEAIGVDIQGEGLYTTCKNSGVPWVNCKSITKWMGESKNSTWYTSSAAMATSFVEHVLKKFYIPEQIKEFERFSPSLPSMVPHFTGRQEECEEVVRNMTSESKRVVTICGSPGFGKTSVAIAVGHRLKLKGLSVHYISLRNVNSTTELMTQLLSCFAPKSSIGGKNLSELTDQLCSVLSEISSNIFIVLDNADNLFENERQETSQEVVNQLEKILSRCERVTFLCTTRMNLDSFLTLKFQDHKSINIKPLDQHSSSKLAQELLPKANESECLRIAKICGCVPLAIKLLCGLMAEDEDEEKLTEFLDEFCNSSESIINLLDNPDSLCDLRLKILFDSSFKKLSRQEQEAFVSLSVIHEETFDEDVAVKVIGGAKSAAKKSLRRLKRKCLVASTKTSDVKSLSFHPLIRFYAQEKAEKEMKEIACQAKIRFLSHYVNMVKDLTQDFLAANSLSAFRKFRIEKDNILRSLTEGLSNETVCKDIFDIFPSADMFLDTMLYFDAPSVHANIYDQALEKAEEQRDIVNTHQLLVGKALYMIPWKNGGTAKELLEKAKGIEEENPSLISNEAKGKRMCYYGFFLLMKSSNEGSELLERGISQLNSENKILKALYYQVLAVYFKFKNDIEKSIKFHDLAVTECKNKGDLLTFLQAIEGDERTEGRKDESQVLILAFALLISCLAKRYRMNNTLERIGVILSQMQEEVEEKAASDRSYFPLLYFINRALLKVHKHEEAKRSLLRSLGKARNVYGDEHEETAKILCSIGIEDLKIKDYVSALEYLQQALEMMLKVYGKEHPETAKCYHKIGETQQEMKDYVSAVESHHEALNISLKLYGKEHPVNCDN